MQARTIARNATVQLLGHGVALAGSVAALAVVARYLGVSGYGTYTVVGAGFALVGAALGGGLDTIAVRLLAGVDGDGGALLFRRLLGLRLAVSVGLAAATVTAVWLAPVAPHVRLAVTVLAGTAVAAAVQASFATLLQAREAFGVPVLADTLGRLVALGGYLVLALALAPWPHERGVRVALVLAASGLATALAAVGLGVELCRRGTTLLPAFDAATWRLAGRQSAGLGLATVLGIASYRLDALVLASLKGSHAAGIYGVAYRFVDAALPLPVFFVAAAFPAFTRSFADGSFRQEHARRALDALLTVSLPLCLGGVAVAPALLSLFVGDRWSAAALPLRLLLLSLPFTFVSMFLVSLAVASGRQRTVVWLTAGGVAANLALNLALVPRFSYSGSAASTLATEIVGTAALLALARGWFGLRLGVHAAARALAAAAGSAAAAAALVPQVGAPAAVALAALVYGAAALALRVVTIPELRLLAGRA